MLELVCYIFKVAFKNITFKTFKTIFIDITLLICSENF